MDVSHLSELDGHFKKLLESMLCLGCDLDEPVKNLFKPFVLSLVHWYTHPLQLRSSHTAILIETLMVIVMHYTAAFSNGFLVLGRDNSFY